MAKMKKVPKSQRFKVPKSFKLRLVNKIAEARKVSKQRAARAASRWGAPAGVALVILLTLISLFSSKDNLQKIKERLVKNPQDFEAHLHLAEKFLKNNQFEEAERALMLAQELKGLEYEEAKILGEKTDSKFKDLWQKKLYSDPKDIRRLIAAWEKIVEEKANYRDGWLQLSVLHYKLYENEKARECLQKALELDPNFEPALELKRIIK